MTAPEREYEYPEAADRLGVSESFLRENIARLPHYKKSLSKRGKGRVTFGEGHIAAIFKMFEHQPETVQPLRPTTRRRAS